jgi:hypothetical protein
MPLGEHLTFRYVATVGGALEHKRDIAPQKVPAESFLLGSITVDGQPHAQGNFRVGRTDFFHGIRDGRQRQKKRIRLLGLSCWKRRRRSPMA